MTDGIAQITAQEWMEPTAMSDLTESWRSEAGHIASSFG